MTVRKCRFFWRQLLYIATMIFNNSHLLECFGRWLLKIPFHSLSVNQIFNPTAEYICKADNYVDLCFADVILSLFIELYHTECYGGIAQLLLRKPACPADFKSNQ